FLPPTPTASTHAHTRTNTTHTDTHAHTTHTHAHTHTHTHAHTTASSLSLCDGERENGNSDAAVICTDRSLVRSALLIALKWDRHQQHHLERDWIVIRFEQRRGTVGSFCSIIPTLSHSHHLPCFALTRQPL
ncbi:hypothetical protein DPEC_G00089400, partial [Dallia pectoralis]